MRAVVVSHVDEFLCLGGSAERGFADRAGFAHERHDRAVRGHARVDVEHFDALDAGDGGYNAVNH
jgi:hypothetical protein